jgi:radical SAM protein with 4Fe4S-binding SPASM domain
VILERMLAPDNWGFSDINLVNQLMRRFYWHQRPTTASCCTIRCAAGTAYLEVASDGRLFPCGRAEDAGCIDAMGDVWSGLQRERLSACISRFHASVPSHRECLECLASSMCDFGCPSYERSNSSNFVVDCTYNRLMEEHLSAMKPTGLDRLRRAVTDLKRRVPPQYAN